MADLTDTEIDTALERGRIAHLVEPRATAVRYDRKSARIIVELNNGCTFAFPPHPPQGVEPVTRDELATVVNLGAGYGLRWEVLDAYFRVSGLRAGVFGTKAYMARRAGQAKSPAKSAAARANGAKGGRPRKQA